MLVLKIIYDIISLLLDYLPMKTVHSEVCRSVILAGTLFLQRHFAAELFKDTFSIHRAPLCWSGDRNLKIWTNQTKPTAWIDNTIGKHENRFMLSFSVIC